MTIFVIFEMFNDDGNNNNNNNMLIYCNGLLLIVPWVVTVVYEWYHFFS